MEARVSARHYLKVNVQINGIDVMLTVDVDGSGTVSKVSVDDDSQLGGASPKLSRRFG